MSTKTEIDIYTYPENATPIALARYQVAVADAFYAGAAIESLPDGEAAWRPCETPIWHFSGCRYRAARPKIAEGYNPDRLTEDQVGVKDGWRLLNKEEHEANNNVHDTHVHDTQFWDNTKPKGQEWSRFGVWSTMSEPLRTKNPPGYYLPKPAKLVPWTFETAPKGFIMMRQKGIDSIEAIIAWREGGIICGNGHMWTWTGLAECAEYSLDGGKTWAKCGTMEGKK